MVYAALDGPILSLEGSVSQLVYTTEARNLFTPDGSTIVVGKLRPQDLRMLARSARARAEDTLYIETEENIEVDKLFF